MKKIFKYFSFLLAFVILTQCKPNEDRTDISGTTNATIDYTHVQTQGYDNQLIMKLNNTNAVPFYEICRFDNKVKLMTGNLRTDTFILPFQGNYLIRTYAYFNNGIVVDSIKVTASQADPVYFADPYWTILSNGAAGRHWKLASKYVGPESDYHSNWWQPDISAEVWGQDSIYFDLNFGFTYKLYQKGTIKTSTFGLSKDSYTKAPDVISFGSADINIGNDDASEMAPANANHYRIIRCTPDSIIFGQGASLTASRTTEDWSWYWVFTRADLAKK